MRVIFLQDVERVGHEGDVVDVADGYARNYLIPRSLAVKASRGALRELEQRRGAIEHRDEEKRVNAANLARDLGHNTITVKATVGEGERLHGQVTAQQIADAALEQLGLEIDRRDIEIPEPIRHLGDYLISARLYKDVRAELPLSVVADSEAKPEEEAVEEEAVEEEAVEEETAEEEAVEEETAEEEAVEEETAEEEPAEEEPAEEEPAEETKPEAETEAEAQVGVSDEAGEAGDQAEDEVPDEDAQ